MEYKIYQMVTEDNLGLKFMSYDFVKKKCPKFDELFKLYRLVYEEEFNSVDFNCMLVENMSKERILDLIFDRFNINLPDDFKGHSLSVSDIVQLDNEFYFCDSFGWQKVWEN